MTLTLARITAERDALREGASRILADEIFDQESIAKARANLGKQAEEGRTE